MKNNMKKWIILFACILITLSMFINAGAVEQQVVAGAGPSTKIVKMFFDEFSKIESGEGYEFVVPPKSIKHAGGIRASGKYVFGRTGRPLNEKEKK